MRHNAFVHRLSRVQGPEIHNGTTLRRHGQAVQLCASVSTRMMDPKQLTGYSQHIHRLITEPDALFLRGFPLNHFPNFNIFENHACSYLIKFNLKLKLKRIS